jgi:type II secretory pathway component PulJ
MPRLTCGTVRIYRQDPCDRAWVTCKQIVRRLRGAGTAQRRCSGLVKEMHIECAQSLRHRDCTQKVRWAWVTGTLDRHCAGPG